MTQPREFKPFQPPPTIPRELLERRQWIGWREWRNPAKLKPDKLPISIPTGSGIGYLEPANHVTYAEAVAAIDRLKLSGVGLVMVKGCGLIGGDLDGCVNPITGEIEAWVLALVELGETYFEFSPSGKGIRFWAIGELPRSVVFAEAGVELYVEKRFLTFSGDCLANAPKEVGAAPKTIEALLKRIDETRIAAGLAPESRSGPGEDEKELDFQTWSYRQTPMGRINTLALQNLDLWIPELFPGARRHQDGWRVSSAELGRGLEEDLSILPRGIKDFGVHDLGDPHEGKRSAIDLVLEWEPFVTNAKEAAQWIAEKIGVPFEAPKPEPGPGGPGPKLVPVLFVKGETLPPREWLVPGWIPMNKVTLIQGDGGDGKTLLMQQLQASCAAALPWIGLDVLECVSAGVYTEDDDYDVKERQDNIDAAYGLHVPSTGKMHVLARDGEENELVAFVGASRKATPTPFYELLREMVLDLKARLLPLDVAVDLYGGNEIVRTEVRALFRLLRALAKAMNGAVVMSMHVSQAGIRSEGGHSGSTDWSNAARARLYLNRPEPGGDPNARTLTRKKSNHAALGDTVNLRWRNGLLVPDFMIATSSSRLAAEDTFLALLDAMIAEGQTLSPKARAGNYAPVLFMQRSYSERNGYLRKDFEMAAQVLLRDGRIKIEVYGPPSDKTERIVRK